jgi:hypothetical protein
VNEFNITNNFTVFAFLSVWVEGPWLTNYISPKCMVFNIYIVLRRKYLRKNYLHNFLYLCFKYIHLYLNKCSLYSTNINEI